MKRGPTGKLYFPRYSKRGCYKGDVGHCCALCYARLVWLAVKRRFIG